MPVLTEVWKYRGCVGKFRHPAKRHAQAHVNRLRDETRAYDSRLHVYKCPACGGWHVGHSGMRGQRVFE
ncbi:MAG TPA: hypothetical protein VNJ02_00245 [Vicinamibacterales bacterium]|nr:hypothetical protein [Vicinamibacterales bacterium]